VGTISDDLISSCARLRLQENLEGGKWVARPHVQEVIQAFHLRFLGD
jgi:hypothetical protein